MIHYFHREGEAVREAIKNDPPELQRFKFFTKKIPHSFKEVGYYDTEEKLSYFDTTQIVGFNNKLFTRPGYYVGFTLDKQKKKLFLWRNTSLSYGRSGGLQHIPSLLKAVKKEWVINEKLLPWLTKGLLEKILLDKITNPTDACKYIIRYQRLGKNTSPALLKEAIKKGDSFKKHLFRASKGITDINYLLAHPYVNGVDNDLINQALILGRKVDLSWSEKRKAEEHNKWTREIMGIEVKHLKDDVLVYEHLPELPPEFTVLDTAYRTFEEGTKMKHCIYTNYWSKIKTRKYMAFHYESPEGPVTIGVRLSPRYGGSPSGTPIYEASIDQQYGIGNKPLSLATKTLIRGVLTDRVLATLALNCQIPENDTTEEEEDEFVNDLPY